MSTDKYLAKPSGACCVKGSIHEGDPRGDYVTIAGVKTYIAKPAEGNANGNVVLYFADVFSLFNNALLIMDAFADAGYLTLGLDYFQGDAIQYHARDKEGKPVPNFDIMGWITPKFPHANEVTPKWVQEVKKQYGKDGAKFACTGYCFGAPYVMDELAGDTVSAGAFGHPAFLKEHHFENIKKPLFLSCSQIDHTFDTSSRNEAIDILNKGNKDYQLQLFSGVAHGFALRADLTKPYELYVKEQSLQGIIEWFDYWLSRPTASDTARSQSQL